MKILFRYILIEYIPFFIFGLFIFTFVLFLGEMFRLSDLIINKHVEHYLAIKLFLSLIPSTLNLSIPLATLMATLLTWGRFSADNEIIAISASGIRLLGSFVFMIFLGLIFSISTLIINEILAPWSNYNIQKLQSQIIQSQSVFSFQEKTFFKIGEMMLYINKIDKKRNRLEGIYIYEKTSELTGQREDIFARFGEIENRDNQIILTLKQGTVHEVDENDSSKYHLLNFTTHTVALDLKKSIVEYLPKKMESMNSSEIEMEIKRCGRLKLDPIPLLIEKYKRISLPFACIVFVFIGFPLAILVSHREKSLNFGVCILFAFAYYLLLIVCQGLANQEVLLPSWAMWLPNGILGGVGLILFVLTRK